MNHAGDSAISIPSFVSRNTLARTNSANNAKNANNIAGNVLCKVCNKYFKGRRGLNIHLGRSATCKQTVRTRTNSITECLTDNNISIPQEVRDAIKSPSTTIEDLEEKCGDGDHTKIKKHESKHNCKTCHILSTKDHFVSSSTHRIYKTIIPSKFNHVDCNTNNLIYLITCRKCSLQYVGETCQKLRERFNHHRSCIAHPDKDHNCRILSQHFSKGACQGASYTVKVIEVLEGDGKDMNGKIDPKFTVIRRKKETEWMLKLRTVYPYGLNDRIGDEYMTDRINNIVFSKFPPLKRQSDHHRVRTKRTVISNLILDHFPYIIMESIKTNRRNTMNLIRVLLSSLRKSHLKKLGDILTDFLDNKSDNFLFHQYFYAALDIISARLDIPNYDNTPSKHIPRYRCNVTFSNKGIDFVNIQKLLNSKDLLQLLPHSFSNKAPMVVYDLSKTIRSKIYNYKQTIRNIDVDEFLTDPSILPCTCEHSPFTDNHHGHIITGDLDIVADEKLRKLLSKGPKYRESENICWNKVRTSLLSSIDESIKKWSKLDCVSASVYSEWRNNVIIKINNKIDSLMRRIKPKRKVKIMNDENVKNHLKDLQDKFVITPIDKASNNIAFICKRHYIEVLVKELGLRDGHNNTYTPVNSNLADIIEKHTNDMHTLFGIKIPNNMKMLPDIYWIPKLHKTPIKERFIIASKECTLKQLNKDITSIFKLAYKQVETYNRKAHKFSGINSFWVIQNSKPVIDTLNYISSKDNAKCISSFDFSTLYTKIPHTKLFNELSSIINFIFKGGTSPYISINHLGIPRWTKKLSSSLSSYNKQSIISALKYLLDNCHFKFGNKLFQQVIGIPMGSDPAPYLANLFLYRYESTWLNKTKKNNYILARKFGRIYRFIDDLIAINDGGEFEKCQSQIYPEELELKKENAVNTSTSFLELDICISDNKFHTKLYDKRDSFGFHICRLPFKDSNIPRRMFYSSACAEILRICRASSSLADFIVSAKTLILRMIRQGAIKEQFKRSVESCLKKHSKSLIKFHVTVNSILDRLFS